MLLSPTQAAAVRVNFINFCSRDALLTSEQAREELGFLFVNPLRTRIAESYLFVSRVGASFTLNRSQRMAVMDNFNAAINHAAFDPAA